MKISLNLLRQLAELDQPVDEIIATISAKIGEVESVKELGPLYEGIVVGRLLESEPHPRADKLSVNTVDIGGPRPRRVIAGDKTLKKGDKVAYIPPGNVVPATAGRDELKLEVRKIRGLDSHGMLASEYELDFSSVHQGVLKLDAKAPPGTALSEVYELDDHILDVETKVLTHRPDMFGHLGFARELSAALGRKFTSPRWYTQKTAWAMPEKELKLVFDNRLPKLVPRFTLAAYDGVIVGPAPLQIQSWLMRLGIRPRNNVVDLTNYLMVLSGQPLHAFDYDKLVEDASHAKFVVRHPKKGEKLKLIDGSTIEPHPKSIVIANGKRAVGLGGVMGGLDTEVDEHSKRVVLEAANFNMYSIRNAAMAHGLTSEAATRFARGPGPEAIAAVQGYARRLMTEWAGAQAASPLVDDYPHPPKPRRIAASVDKINRLLGLDARPSSMAETLRNAELDVELKGRRLSVDVPSWRQDLNIEADIAEEVGRLTGFNLIEARRPRRSIEPVPRLPLNALEDSIRRILSAGGANEALLYSGLPEKLVRAAGQDPEQAYRVRNALSPEVELMRLSLTPSLLDKVYPNLRLGFERFVLFEIGVAHNRRLIEDKLPDEQNSLALVSAAGRKSGAADSGAAYFTARTYLDYLLDSLGYEFQTTTSRGSGDPWLAQASEPYEQTRSAYISVDGRPMGIIGEFTAGTARQLKLPRQTAGFELNTGRLLEAERSLSRYRRLPKYPEVVVDLTLKSPSNLPFARLSRALASYQLEEAAFSFYPVEIFAPDKSSKHTTFRLKFVHTERTLTQAEVNEWLAAIVKRVNRRTDATQV